MARKIFKSFTWLVTNFDCNAQAIKYYDVLKSYDGFVKTLKKRCDTKEEFSDGMRREMSWRFWSRSEYELIIEIDDNERVWLNPWVGCREPEKVRVDVTDRDDFDWRGFAEDHILHKGLGDGVAKIDIYDQLLYRWDEFIDYAWNYHHKHQRKKKPEETK